MKKYKELLKTVKYFVKAKRTPEGIEILFGIRDGIANHGHAAFISSNPTILFPYNETIPSFLRPEEGIDAYISDTNLLVVEGYEFKV